MTPLEIFSIIAEITAALLATIYYSKYKNGIEKWMLPYLWYVVVHEITSHVIVIKLGLLRYQLINIYSIVTVFFIIWLIYSTVVSHIHKRLLKILFVLFIMACFYELLYNGLQNSWQIVEVMSPIAVIISFCLYCIYLFSTKGQINFTRDLFTYIILGFTIFFTACPVIFTAVYIFSDNMELVIRLKQILYVVIILMYSIFSFGFIWSEKKI